MLKAKKKKSNKYQNSYKRHQIFFICAIVFLLIAYFIGLVNKNVKPILEAVAESKGKYLASTAINDAVIQTLEDVNYTDLVEVHTAVPKTTNAKDKQGKEEENEQVASLSARIAVMNKMAANLTKTINGELQKLENKHTNVRIPVSTIFGEQLFANMGPMLPIRVLPIGSANVTFSTEFSQAGINQTRHRIYLKVAVNIRMVSPLLVSHKDTVETMIPVAETVIVGPIPQTYVNTSPENVLDVVP